MQYSRQFGKVRGRGKLINSNIYLYLSLVSLISFVNDLYMILYFSSSQVKKKQSASGEVLGDDVLKMVVEPFIDHCLIMGFFVVYSLINWKMWVCNISKQDSHIHTPQIRRLLLRILQSPVQFWCLQNELYITGKQLSDFLYVRDTAGTELSFLLC